MTASRRSSTPPFSGWACMYESSLANSRVGDGVEQSVTRREVMIDGHGGDAHGFGGTAHGDRFGPFFLKNGESHRSDAIGDIPAGTHDLYEVYSIRCIDARNMFPSTASRR